MGGSKAAITSTGVIGAVVAGVALAAPLLGYKFSSDAQQALSLLLENGFLIGSNIVAFAGAAVALYGRITATKEITGIVTPK